MVRGFLRLKIEGRYPICRSMPNRPRSHILEDLSRSQLHQAFERECWTVEDLTKDYGEDLLVRIFEGGHATPYSFFVQAKATDHIEKHMSKGSETICVTVELGHVRHWIRFQEPVFLTVWDSASGATYWVCVQNQLGEDLTIRSRSKTIQVMIPRRNVLDDDGLKRIRGITKLRFGRSRRHKEAEDILIEELGKMGKMVTGFYPDSGLISFKLPTGGGEDVIFGAMGASLSKLSSALNLTPENLLRSAIKGLAAEVARPTWSAQNAKDRIEEDDIQRERDAADEDG